MRVLLGFCFTVILASGCQTSYARRAAAALQAPLPSPQLVAENTSDPVNEEHEFKTELARAGIGEIVLARTGEDEISYNGYKIKNSLAGLSISRNGRRRIFIKNRHDRDAGYYDLRKLLGGKGKQLIYLTATGGNHCCRLFSIVDLSSSKPRKIFDSEDYGVQGNLDLFFHLGVFDKDKDGKLEIIQEAEAYTDWDCAYAARSRVAVGFTYHEKAGRYLPLRALTPYQQRWNNQLGAELKRDKAAIKVGQNPENPGCSYDQIIMTTAYSYIYAGRKKEALRFLRKTYLAANYDKDGMPHADPVKTKQKVKEFTRIIGKGAKGDKLQRAVYK